MALLSLLTKDGSDIETTNCGSFNPIALDFIIFSFKTFNIIKIQKYIIPLTPPNFLHYFNVKGLDLTQVWHFNLLYSSSQIFPGEGW